MKYSFKNDYSEICHKKVLDKIVCHANEQNNGYGLDKYTDIATKMIKDRLNYQNCDIHFIPIGTQTNMLVISSFLKPYEAVMAVSASHINVHETGAIEGTGHKILICDDFNGKILPEEIKRVYNLHIDEHMVKPRMVFISNATETGSIYKKEELLDLRKVCDELGLLLYLDGARLVSALGSDENDLTLHDIACLTDVFYIGGTKSGACLGEALIIVNNSLKENFRYHIKHRGAMLAKGFFIALNFIALFEDDLFLEIGKSENNLAQYLATGLSDLGFDFMCESSTNQIFPIFSNSLITEIKEDYLFEEWMSFDSDHTVIRLVTSFSTTKEVCDEFLMYLTDKV